MTPVCGVYAVSYTHLDVYKRQFWESAEKTSVYAEIRQVLESYTDEERKRDAVSLSLIHI